MISCISNIFASEITTKKIFDSISKREQDLKSDIPMSSTFYVLIPANSSDPNQGLLLEECSATWNKDNIYMKIDYKYLQEPLYFPPNSSKVYQPVDYDSNKRLIVWRHLQVYIMSTAEKTERIDELQLLLVSPDGTVEIKGSHTSKDIFPSNSLVRGDFDFRSFLYATGLNFYDSINKDNAFLENTSNSNFIVNFRGKFGKGSKGIWKLTVDPNEDFFVKDASYTAALDDYNNPAIQPTIRISTSDIVKKDGLQYARQGRLTHIYTMDFADINISKKDNLELREEVKKRMANLPPGSRITDFNGIKPTVTTTK